MAEFVCMSIPAGRPSGATHYNPRFTRRWEKQQKGSDQVSVYDPIEKGWSAPINRPGGLVIQSTN